MDGPPFELGTLGEQRGQLMSSIIALRLEWSVAAQDRNTGEELFVQYLE